MRFDDIAGVSIAANGSSRTRNAADHADTSHKLIFDMTGPALVQGQPHEPSASPSLEISIDRDHVELVQTALEKRGLVRPRPLRRR